MNKVFGFLILFAAAWLMVRLQAGSGSCCGGDKGVLPEQGGTEGEEDQERGRSCKMADGKAGIEINEGRPGERSEKRWP